MVCRYSIALSALQAEREADRMRTPVLLVTDIGADVDDTLALMVRDVWPATCMHRA